MKLGIISLALLLTGCAQKAYVKALDRDALLVISGQCEAELTELIWTRQKPLLTHRWFRKCLRRQGYELTTIATVFP